MIGKSNQGCLHEWVGYHVRLRREGPLTTALPVRLCRVFMTGTISSRPPQQCLQTRQLLLPAIVARRRQMHANDSCHRNCIVDASDRQLGKSFAAAADWLCRRNKFDHLENDGEHF